MLLNNAEVVLEARKGLCPTCLKIVKGFTVGKENRVFFRKECPEHGVSEVEIWPDVAHYQWMQSFNFPQPKPIASCEEKNGCPFDCGLCSAHLAKPALVEIEVTQQCNLACPVCFMDAQNTLPDPTLKQIKKIFTNIVGKVGPQTSVQVTGGEPTVRSDLPKIVQAGREMGFSAIEINTNGLVIAQDMDYLKRLKGAGISGVYLQFDGLDGESCQQLRGGDYLRSKLGAVEHCRQLGVQVVLAMTVVWGINQDQIGEVIQYALENLDVVVGVALQPAFTSGRFEVQLGRKLNMGDVIFLLAEQCQAIRPYDFYPLGCSHPLCSAGTFLIQEEQSILPLTRTLSREEYQRSFDKNSPQGSVFLDILAARGNGETKGLSVLVMDYMDVENLDIARLQQCSMVVADEKDRLIPFCAYHLTNADGKDIYKTGRWKGHGFGEREGV